MAIVETKEVTGYQIANGEVVVSVITRYMDGAHEVTARLDHHHYAQADKDALIADYPNGAQLAAAAGW